MGGGKFFIEEKLDGERMQLHKRGNEYFYCSRYLLSLVPRTVLANRTLGREKIIHICMESMLVSGASRLSSTTRLTLELRSECRRLATELLIDKSFSIILDGEMLVWDPVSERNLPFGTLKTAALSMFNLGSVVSVLVTSNVALDKSKKDINPRPCCTSYHKTPGYSWCSPLLLNTVKVFDLLYLNGTSLLHKSLKFRKRNLKSCIAEVKGRIEFSLEYEGRTAQDVRNRMEDIMAQRGEGLVLKHPSSEYILNGRNRDWIKVKPEYMVSTVMDECLQNVVLFVLF